MPSAAQTAAFSALLTVAAAQPEWNVAIGSNGLTGLLIGLFLVFVLFMGLSSILSIQTPDAIGRSFKKEE